MVSNTATVLRHQVSAEDLELMHERYGIDTKNQTTRRRVQILVTFFRYLLQVLLFLSYPCCLFTY